MPDEAWPPDWREARAVALDAEVIRLGEFTVFCDEVEELVSDDDELARDVRSLVARVKARRNGCRDEAQALQAMLAERG